MELILLFEDVDCINFIPHVKIVSSASRLRSCFAKNKIKLFNEIDHRHDSELYLGIKLNEVIKVIVEKKFLLIMKKGN